MVSSLGGVDLGSPVDLLEHSKQTATRALKDGASEEKVVCALLHDVGELLAPSCHGEVGRGGVITENLTTNDISRSCHFKLKMYLDLNYYLFE